MWKAKFYLSRGGGGETLHMAENRKRKILSGKKAAEEGMNVLISEQEEKKFD